MASSRRSAKNADQPARQPVLEAVRATLAALGLTEPGSSPEPASPVAIVAFSGGLDSSVLLHALAACVAPARLHAVHVHHGLQAVARDWPAHCAEVARALGVGFTCRHLTTRPARGESLEAWARHARYAALSDEARGLDCDVVFTAHHADDQAETVLLRLARGAGMLGLGAMAMQQPMLGLRLIRPLLAVPRDDLLAYAQAASLSWVEDPSNVHTDRARNQIRAAVLPALQAAVPGARENLVRAAELAREAQAVLAELAHADLRVAQTLAADRLAGEGGALAALLSRADVAPVLHRAALRELSPPRQRLAMRAWLAQCRLAPPSQSVLTELSKQLIEAAGPYGEVLREDVVMRRYRDWIWVQRDRSRPMPPDTLTGLRWQGETELRLPDARLVFSASATGMPAGELRASTLSVRPLASSTRVRLRAGGPSRILKHWHQQFGVPAHWRASLPGVFVGEQLVFVAGLGTHHWARDERESAAACAPCVAVRWEPIDSSDFRGCLCAAQHPD